MDGVFRMFLRVLAGAVLLVGGPSAVDASVSAEIGPYRVWMVTEPGVIPVGKVWLRIDVKDAAGKPVAGAVVRSLVKMPGVSMGERPAVAEPILGTPGSYATDVVFARAGGYKASITISGPLGQASGHILLETGQNTESGSDASALSVRSLLLWLVAVVLAGVVVLLLLRLRQSGNDPR